jgi:hypothetical protein
MPNKREVITAHLTQFLNGNYTVGSPLGFADESPVYLLNQFLDNTSESNWNVATNILAALINKCNTVAYPAGLTYRIVATLADGTVWYDSAKTNTYAKFQSKTINENHNTRRPFMQVLLNDANYAYESKISNSTGIFEERVCLRLGSSNIQPSGVIGLSVQEPI